MSDCRCQLLMGTIESCPVHGLPDAVSDADKIIAEMKRWAYSDAARTLEAHGFMPLTAMELITHIEKWLAEQMGT